MSGHAGRSGCGIGLRGSCEEAAGSRARLVDRSVSARHRVPGDPGQDRQRPGVAGTDSLSPASGVALGAGFGREQSAHDERQEGHRVKSQAGDQKRPFGVSELNAVHRQPSFVRRARPGSSRSLTWQFSSSSIPERAEHAFFDAPCPVDVPVRTVRSSGTKRQAGTHPAETRPRPVPLSFRPNDRANGTPIAYVFLSYNPTSKPTGEAVRNTKFRSLQP